MSGKIKEFVFVGYDVYEREVGFFIMPQNGAYTIFTVVDGKNDLEVLPMVCKTQKSAIRNAYLRVREMYIFPDPEDIQREEPNDYHY